MKLLFLHAYGIKPWESHRNNALEWVPPTHAHTHTHDKWIFKTDQLVANSLITQLVVIKEVDISRFTETIRQRKSYPSHNIMAWQMWTTAPDSHIYIKSSAAAIKMTMTLKENILVCFGQDQNTGWFLLESSRVYTVWQFHQWSYQDMHQYSYSPVQLQLYTEHMWNRHAPAICKPVKSSLIQ